MGIFAYSSDSSEFSSDLTTDSNTESIGGVFDRDLEDFFLREKQKASINSQILEFNDICWEKCLTEKPGMKLSGKAETCLNNCVDRFIDTSVFIMNRFALTMQKSSM